jgi:ankyrin repeat protein
MLQEGVTPLHAAAFYGWSAVVNKLISAGAGVNFTTRVTPSTPICMLRDELLNCKQW